MGGVKGQRKMEKLLKYEMVKEEGKERSRSRSPVVTKDGEEGVETAQ